MILFKRIICGGIFHIKKIKCIKLINLLGIRVSGELWFTLYKHILPRCAYKNIIFEIQLICNVCVCLCAVHRDNKCKELTFLVAIKRERHSPIDATTTTTLCTSDKYAVILQGIWFKFAATMLPPLHTFHTFTFVRRILMRPACMQNAIFV